MVVGLDHGQVLRSTGPSRVLEYNNQINLSIRGTLERDVAFLRGQ